MVFNPDKLSRVTLKKNPHYKKSGEKSYAYALNKYNINPTTRGPFSMINNTLHKKHTADSEPGFLTADDIQWDAMYLASVEIGTPKPSTRPQTLTLDFDTGSSDLWCWSSRLDRNLQIKAAESGHKVFKPEDSETWQDLPGESYEIWYGDGSHVNGNVGADDLTVGGLLIKGQAIETATWLSKQFRSGEGDGLLGLAFGKINTVKPTKQKTPVDNMIKNDIIPRDRRLFTAYLGSWRDKNDPDQGQSFYTFGYIDQDVVDSTGQKMHYVDIDSSKGFWQFPSTAFAVNGDVTELSGNTAIADTGTTLALVSNKVCRAVYEKIPGAFESDRVGGWIFPIDTPISKRPTVEFAVGDQLFAVEKEDLGFVDLGNGYAYGGIQSRGNLNFDILGDTFLKALYAVFDQGNERFGCVQRVDPTQSARMPPADSA